MAKRRRDPESDGGTASPSATSGLKAIFVSTSLDTHLAMTLSLSDTVADFKEKIMLQHEQCFPETGPLIIHSLKVEHQGKMFQLVSDTVVSIAFEGCEGRWDLFVDASFSLEVVKEQNVIVPCNKDKVESSRLLLASDANASKSTGESSQHSLDVGHVDGTLKSVLNDHSSMDDSKIQNEKLPLRKSYDTRSGGGLNAKKKQKVKHSLHVGESSLDATRTSPQTTMSTRSNNEAGDLGDSVVHASPKVSTDVLLGGRDAGASPHNTIISDAKTSEQAEPESHVFGKGSPSIRSQVSDMKNISPEKSVAELRENMTSPDALSLQVQEEQPAISTGTPKKLKRKKQHQETDVQLGGRDAGASPQNTMFSGPNTSEQAEPESHVFGKDAPSIPDSDLITKSLDKSVAELKENMTSPDVPSLQVQEEQPAISTSTTRKAKRKKKHQETNSSVPCDNAATSKPGTVLQGSAVTEEACEGQILGSGNHGMVNDECLLTSTANLQNTDDKEDGHLSSNHKAGLFENDKPPDSVRKATAMRETVICIGMVDKFPEADVSKSKIRNSKKSAVRKLDQLDADHDLSAPSKVCVAVEAADLTGHIDQSSRDENVLPQNDPKESEENSELAKNNVPGAVSTGRSNKHLDSDERNLNEKDSASDIAFSVRDDPVGVKSDQRQKKRKTKKLASKDRNKDANGPSALKSLSEYIPDDVMADKSIFSRSEGVEEPKMVSPTNSHKNANGKTASDYDDVNFPLSEAEHNQSRNEDLDLMYDSQATVQSHVNMEHAKEAECPMDQPDEEQKNKGTEKKKKKKKAKGAGNSTGDGLGIPEVNQESIGNEELASLAEKSTDLNYTDEIRTVDQLGVSGLVQGKNSDLKGTTGNEQLLQNSDGPDVPAHEIESNHEDLHATNNGLASEGENGSVNFRNYFVPGDDRKGASSNKIEGESNAVEGAEKANEQTTVPEKKRKPSKSSGNHKNSTGRSTDAKSHERPLKEKQGKSVSEMGTSTNSRKRLKSLSTTRDANVKALKKSVDAARVAVPPRLKENNGSLISSNTKSASRDSKKTLLNKSNQKKQTGINNKNTAGGKISGKKDLLTTKSLFGNDSSSSDDENGKVKSGSSTQSPSDSSSSSSSSSSSEDLMSGAGSNNNRGKTPFGSKLANPRNMTMDMIMRSSNRFKKAKLTASQIEADSQQVDFVPETQP